MEDRILTIKLYDKNLESFSYQKTIYRKISYFFQLKKELLKEIIFIKNCQNKSIFRKIVIIYKQKKKVFHAYNIEKCTGMKL